MVIYWKLQYNWIKLNVALATQYHQMQLTYKHPFNQSTIELELSEQALSSLDVLEKSSASDTQITSFIERMNESA